MLPNDLRVSVSVEKSSSPGGQGSLGGAAAPLLATSGRFSLRRSTTHFGEGTRTDTSQHHKQAFSLPTTF
jgi:hypothetical protein